jgi:hypothetical protein
MTRRTHEFWVSEPVDEALRKVKITLKNLGDLKAVVPNQYVVGTAKFGVKDTTLKIAWRPEDQPDVEAAILGPKMATGPARVVPGTMLTLEVSAEEGGEAAIRSAIERFEDAYRHYDQPDFTPDRLGIMPITIIGIVVVLVLLTALLARRTNLMKPEPKPTASATAAQR